MLAGRRSQRSSTKNKSKTICIGGAACALLIWRKPTWIGRKPTKWVIGTEPVGIGTRIIAAIRSFRGTGSSIAHSVGGFIHRLTWASRRFSSSATSTMILMTSVTTIGTTLATGTTIGTTFAIGGTLVIGSIMKLTTTNTWITASTTGLRIPATAASPVSTAVVAEDSMEAKASTADTAASTEEAALAPRTEWEAALAPRTEWEAAAFMVEAAVTAEH